MSSKKNILFIQTQAPYGDQQAQEGLDMILGASAFYDDVAIIFVSDGIWQLCQSQAPNTKYRKELAKIYQSLEFYDIDKIYVDANSLTARDVKPEELLLTPKVIEQEKFNSLIEQYSQVLTL